MGSVYAPVREKEGNAGCAAVPSFPLTCVSTKPIGSIVVGGNETVHAALRSSCRWGSGELAAGHGNDLGIGGEDRTGMTWQTRWKEVCV